MIDKQLEAKIRRLFFAEHWKVGTIASELGLHHDVVRRVIASEAFVSRGTCARGSRLDPFKPFIVETLERHPRLRATRMMSMIESRGYEGGIAQLRRYVREVRPAGSREGYLRTDAMAGEQAQVDWGHFGLVEVEGTQRRLSCFVMVLAYSRAMFARFTLDQSMESFLRAHAEAFEHFGGVPRVVLYDNLKSVVLERAGEHVRFHDRILELAGHYHFEPRPCAPYRPNEKGKVERAIQYVRGSFFEARRVSELSVLQDEIGEWIETVAHARTHPTDPERKPVSAMLELERPRLLPLPAHRPPLHLVRPVRSGKQPYVTFDGNQYSIPHALVRRPLTLVATEHEIRLLEGTDEVARHTRCYGRRHVVEDPKHLEGLAADKRGARLERGRDRVRALCPSADAFYEALVERSAPLGPETARLTRLLDDYGAEVVDKAIARALERGTISAKSVEHIADQLHRSATRRPVITSPALSARAKSLDVAVVPHALGDYDAVIRTEEESDVLDS